MNIISKEKMWIVCVGTYPPRECGIATFTADFIGQFDALFSPSEETKIVAMNTMNSSVGVPEYPPKVFFQISENETEEYISVAKQINEIANVKLVSIQHEYGIYGTKDGERILDFLKEIKKPVAVTFHTVLPGPSDHLKKVTCEIIERADRLIVMTQTSKELLEKTYDAPSEKIAIIPHGIHARPYTNGGAAKKSLGLDGKRVLATFGLLNKGKGIEFAIAAMPEIIKQYPNTVYAVIGATHPVVMKREGPVYLESLKAQVKNLGLEKHVMFYERYLKTDELLTFLEAVDVYLSLSQNPDQAVSGTFTYALGMGRPVVSTPFAQAREVITPELGQLINFSDSTSISIAVLDLFGDPGRLLSMSKTAYFRTRNMTWDNVALTYMREFKKISPTLALKAKSLPPIKLDHLKRMTDDFGIFQFAILNEPDPNSGYTIDDNARALIVVCWYAHYVEDPELMRLAEIYLSFLEGAVKEHGGFKNYFNAVHEANYERNQIENLEDADARAIRALAELIVSKAPENLKARARVVFTKQLNFHNQITSPRAMASHVKAYSILLAYSDPELREYEEEMKKRLVYFADFIVDAFQKNSTPEWRWFEAGMTYSNAALPSALLHAYSTTGDIRYINIAKTALDFLIESSFNGEVCMPVGQAGWFRQGGVKQMYDQQPEEVYALVLALNDMYKITGDEEYLKRKEQAFEWFLGNNILGQVIYSQMSGGSYDGLGENHVNLNQGAESTISYLLARVNMEKPR